MRASKPAGGTSGRVQPVASGTDRWQLGTDPLLGVINSQAGDVNNVPPAVLLEGAIHHHPAAVQLPRQILEVGVRAEVRSSTAMYRETLKGRRISASCSLIPPY